MISRLSWPPTFDLRREPFLWALAGIISFFFFVFLTFPYGALQSRLLLEISKGTGWEVRAADWSAGIPLGVEWRDMSWEKPGVMNVPVNEMRINLGLLGLLIGRQAWEGQIQFPGSGKFGGGRATAVVNASSWSFQGPISLKGRLREIDLSVVAKPYISQGLLQADVDQRWEMHGKDGLVFKGNGSWKAEIKELVLERIPAGGMTIPSLSFSRVTLSAACRDASCDIGEFKGEGPDGSITAQGRILLQRPIQASTLDVSVTVLAGAGWARKSSGLPIPPLPPGSPLTFKLAGSVANPKITL
ncbi:type II secretion system protein GspN [Petrachloros mirabilis]